MGPGLLPVVGTFQPQSPVWLSSVFCSSQWTCLGHCHLDSEGISSYVPCVFISLKEGFLQIKGLQLRKLWCAAHKCTHFQGQQYHMLVCTAQGPTGVTRKGYFSSVFCTLLCLPLPWQPLLSFLHFWVCLIYSLLLSVPLSFSSLLSFSSPTPVSSLSFLFSTILPLLHCLCSVKPVIGLLYARPSLLLLFF